MNKQDIADLFKAVLPQRSDRDSLELGAARLDNVMWHDFSAYRFIASPKYMEQPIFTAPPVEDVQSELELPSDPDSSSAMGDVAVFKGMLRAELSRKYSAVAEETIRIPYGIYQTISIPLSSLDFEPAIATSRVMEALELSPEALADLLEIFWRLDPSARTDLIRALKSRLPPIGAVGASITSADDIPQATADAILLGRAQDTGGWVLRLTTVWPGIVSEVHALFPEPQEATPIPPPEPAPVGYAFHLYKPGTTNLGLRLVNRQEWRALGNQRGEVVRTLPLGPKQVEKVSTKIMRRNKVQRTSENLKSTETTTEQSDSAKDSSEVVREASESFGWHAEAEASTNWISGSAKISGGMEGASAEESKESTTKLTETMQKMANKIRTETKVVISSKGETQFDSDISAEISNPNDEIALTYVYSKLQRQYEVFTGLAEVADVVLVAEEVPLPDEVTPEWVKRYDWVIAKALLDDSFREALNEIGRLGGQAPTPLVSDMKTAMDETIKHLGSLHGVTGSLTVSQVDIAQEAQRGYVSASNAQRERVVADAAAARRQYRLLQHIRDNILHYCRAIWMQEDPEQRILRYRRLGTQVPIRFRFVGTVGETSGEWDIDGLLGLLATEGDSAEIRGEFVPLEAPDSVIPLADLINPAGPIGFHGNYAVYYISSENLREDVLDVLQILKSPYQGDDGDDVLIDPGLKRLREEVNQAGYNHDLNDEKKREMIEYVPWLRLQYDIAKAKEAAGVPQAVSDFLGKDELFKAVYAEYLFRKERTRRFPVETNNLLIDIMPGDGSALETFKRAHRYVDVWRALEETDKATIENKRRRELVETEGNLGDPDIDRVIVLTPNKKGAPVNVSLLWEEDET